MDQEELPEVYATRTWPGRKRMIGYAARSLGRTYSADSLKAEAESNSKRLQSGCTQLAEGKKQSKW